MKVSIFFVPLCIAATTFADEPLTPIPTTERRTDVPAINQPIPAAELNGGHRPPAPAFIIGVWYQPRNSLALWKARGINTLVGYEGEGNSVPLADWQAAAEMNELFMIRQPSPNPLEDAKNPYLLAWLHGDEPDIHNTDPRIVQSGYAGMKKDSATVPVFLNVSGGNLLFKKTPRASYEQYFQAADWVGNDFYPVTGWNQPTWIPRMGQAIDQCRDLSKGKPQLAFVEGANQKLEWLPKDVRGVTPAEFRAEIWTCVIHGVKGIVYFPQQMTPFKFDAMPSGVSVEMMRQNRVLEAIAPALDTRPNPPEMKVSVDAPLEATWRRGRDGKLYAIVLNLSNERQIAQPLRFTGFPAGPARDLSNGEKSLNITSNGVVTDFEPYGVHVLVMEGKQP